MPEPVVPAVVDPAAAPVVDVAAFQKQIDELKEQVAEGQRTAQYWADKAKTPAAAKTEPVEEEPDVLEAITTGGAKGFDALAKKRGFIQREEVESLINTRAASLTKEQELIGRFPDLKKKDSEFFKATAAHYGDLVKNGTPQAVAMEIAADRAELEFLRSGKLKLPGAEDTKAEKEAARLARIAAQSGDGGGRRSAAVDEDDDTLGEDEMVAVKRLADALEIPLDKAKERYIARAKKGVQVGLRMGKK